MSVCRICLKPAPEGGLCAACEAKLAEPIISAGDGEIVRVDAAPSPLAIIERAVELKMSAAEITALVSLHNSQEDRRAQQEFQRAMVLCQKEMPVAVRDRKNPKTSSHFASLDRINVIAHPIYTKYGFYISFREEAAAKSGWIRIVAEVGHEAGHRQTAYRELPHDGIGPQGNAIGGMNAVQGAISTGSYAQRVLLCEIFNITIANSDHDGEAFIDEPDAAEIERIVKKLKMPAGQFTLFLQYAGAKPVDPLKPAYSDIRGIYKGMLAAVMDDLGRREREHDRANGGQPWDRTNDGRQS